MQNVDDNCSTSARKVPYLPGLSEIRHNTQFLAVKVILQIRYAVGGPDNLIPSSALLQVAYN